MMFCKHCGTLLKHGGLCPRCKKTMEAVAAPQPKPLPTVDSRRKDHEYVQRQRQKIWAIPK